jgi:hypothetical protein
MAAGPSATGDGADAMIEPLLKHRIICNLHSGGTNPGVIRNLQAYTDTEIKHLTNLHAKVTITTTGAVIGSANYSKAGLAPSSNGDGSWLEAAMFIPASHPACAEARSWFWHLWKEHGRALTDEDIIIADSNWANRQDSLNPAQEAPQRTIKASDDTELTLTEAMLFRNPWDRRKQRIRMANDSIEGLVPEGIIPQNRAKVGGWAANAIFTFSGKEVETNIPGQPQFTTPDQVIKRARRLGKKNPHAIMRTVERIVDADEVAQPVRYWARKLLTEYDWQKWLD